MDIFERKKDTPPRTCKTKGGKEVDAEKYKAVCDKLELARSTRAKKLAESKGVKQEAPKETSSPSAQEAKPTDDKLSRAMCLLALQDKKIKELTEKLSPNPPKPEAPPKPEPSAPIDIPKKPQPYQRHWALSDD